MSSVILHIDMDAFYASIEQRDHPQLRGKPVIVGGQSERGVVAAASYEARKFGIRSAMPIKMAKEKCPELIAQPPRFDTYKAISREIQQIFLIYSDLVEPLSLDESYIDISSLTNSFEEARKIALEIKDNILNNTSLTSSAGISYNKFLAKTASDINKPNGLFIIKPEDALSFIGQMPIEQFHGVGKATAKKMYEIDIYNGEDLRKKEEYELVKLFGKAGHHYYNIARGIDQRTVNPKKERKSVGVERTFNRDIKEKAMLQRIVNKLAEILTDRAKKHQKTGYTLTLKLKYADFRIVSKSKTFNQPILSKDFASIGLALLSDCWNQQDHVRLLGLTLSQLPKKPTTQQLTIPFDFPGTCKPISPF